MGRACVVTGRGDVLHQGADQSFPTGLAQCLGSLIIREEAISKILFMAQNSVQSGNKRYMARLKADSRLAAQMPTASLWPPLLTVSVQDWFPS